MTLSELKEVVRKYESGIFYGDRVVELAEQVPTLIDLLERAEEIMLAMKDPEYDPVWDKRQAQLLSDISELGGEKW